MDNQPAPIHQEQTRNCSNCAFCLTARMPPPNIGSFLECRFFPPQVIALATPNGVNLQTMFPPVNEKMICHQHRLKSDVENAPKQLESN